MPAPTNISAGTATDLGSSYPISLTQDVNFGGATYTVWFKFTAPLTREIGIWAFGVIGGAGTYRPTMTVYGPNSSVDVFLGISPQPNVPIQIPAIGGDEYFIKVVSSLGNVAVASLALSLLQAPEEDLPLGSILVNNESPEFPAIIMNRLTGATLRFLYPFAAGESGDNLETGLILLEDYTTSADTMRLYDETFSLVAIVTMTMVDGVVITATPAGNHFYAGSRGAGATSSKVRTVSALGALGGTIYDLGSPQLRALAVNAAETILYYALGGTPSTVRTWNIAGNVAGANFQAAVTGFSICFEGIRVLADGTILVAYNRTSGVATPAHYIKRFSAAGALLNTYEISAQIDRVARAENDPFFFVVWIFPTSVRNEYLTIRVSDGAIVADTGVITQFNDGVYQDAPSETPSRFGPSFSCPLIILRGTTPPSLSRPAVPKLTMRRLRRSPHINEERIRLFCSRFELDLQRGLGIANNDISGLTKYESPTVMLRVSADGGKTWGLEEQMGAGEVGNYLARTFAVMLGSGDDFVFEVTVSDPVIGWYLAQAYANFTKGLS